MRPTEDTTGALGSKTTKSAGVTIPSTIFDTGRCIPCSMLNIIYRHALLKEGENSPYRYSLSYHGTSTDQDILGERN